MTEMIKLIEPESPSIKVKLSDCSEDLNRMELKMKLIEHMKYYQGIGLSANQIGIMERVFVISHKGDPLQDKFRSVIKFEKVKNFSHVS